MNYLGRALTTQSRLYSQWFGRVGKLSKLQQKPNVPKFSYDWEHQRWEGQSKDATPSVLKESELFLKASDEVKKLYSYGILPRRHQTEDGLQELFDTVNLEAFEPKQQDLATHIVRLTFAIRNMKSLLESRHKDGQMRTACATYIGRRKGLLHQLRRENYELFERLCSTFNIEYKENNSFDMTVKLSGKRKLEERNKSYEVRKKKMEDFREQLLKERDSFYTEKETILQDLNLQLNDANMDIRSLFDEVVKERREELMRPVRQDDEHWYEQEKELKEMYARLRAEKEERINKKKRK